MTISSRAARTVLALGAVGALASGCATSAEPLAARLDALPVPPGASATTQAHHDGDFEIGPEATREFASQYPVVRSCVSTLADLVRRGYAVSSWGEKSAPVADVARFCRTEIDSVASYDVASVLAVIRGPGRERADGELVVLFAPRSGPATLPSLIRFTLR